MNRSMDQEIRVFLLDDHPAVREGIALLLARYNMTVCGEAGSGQEAMQQLAGLVPDLLLLDLSLGDESGLDLIEDVKASGIKVLIYTMHDDPRQIRLALAAGADGYVTKREISSILYEAVHAIRAGQLYLSPVALASINNQGMPDKLGSLVERLSPRELAIFKQIGRGCSKSEIAETLEISTSTVETHYTRIIAKLECSGTREMRRRAILYRLPQQT